MKDAASGKRKKFCSGEMDHGGKPALRSARILACGFGRHPCRQFQSEGIAGGGATDFSRRARRRLRLTPYPTGILEVHPRKVSPSTSTATAATARATHVTFSHAL